MRIFKTIKYYLDKAKQENVITSTINQYKIYDNEKYIGMVTFSVDTLNVAKISVNRLNHYKIHTVVTIELHRMYVFKGVNQYGEPVNLVAKRIY